MLCSDEFMKCKGMDTLKQPVYVLQKKCIAGNSSFSTVLTTISELVDAVRKASLFAHGSTVVWFTG